MTQKSPQPSAFADDVTSVYESLLQDIRARDDGLGSTAPDGISVPAVAENLRLPLELWVYGKKPTRTVPALVAYDDRVEVVETQHLKLLVGLDVLVTMLDEFIDTANASTQDRLQVAVNVAFASLLSFVNVPNVNAEAITETITEYLVETARIPSVERAVHRELVQTDSIDDAVALMQFAYAYRARDITAFGQVPGVLYDIDEDTVDRTVRDLVTYRAHSLVFDDIRDVRQDVHNGVQTPVVWLLWTHDDVSIVRDVLAELFAQFEYADTPYRYTLRELEHEPDDVESALEAGKNALSEESACLESTSVSEDRK
ncbi:hypothetical protein EGH21_21205 [Halomicroarcula sp. F13]|uniref:Uncharacterized protein n=1 Tax=Haloarcula rubra TaxID=2487747 RepID=A0AAW4PWK9_9EURY|nr:hypothetical protein [Halomicroarcula rubra]MBX0325547.1 hypothetical protein [Halomicroarcula rubra]